MRFLAPHRNIAFSSAVIGTVDTGYQPEWLTDGRHSFPVRGSGGALSLTVVPPTSGQVDLVVVSHHNLDEDVTLGGDLSATITAPTEPTDGIPNNWFWLGGAPVSVASFTFGTTGNSRTPVVGELFAGASQTVESLKLGWDITDLDYSLPPGGQLLSMMPFDSGGHGSVLKGSQYYKTSDLATIRSWRLAQRSASLPSVIIMDDDVQEAIVANFSALSYSRESTDVWLVQMEFTEFPRTRW